MHRAKRSVRSLFSRNSIAGVRCTHHFVLWFSIRNNITSTAPNAVGRGRGFDAGLRRALSRICRAGSAGLQGLMRFKRARWGLCSLRVVCRDHHRPSAGFWRTELKVARLAANNAPVRTII